MKARLVVVFFLTLISVPWMTTADAGELDDLLTGDPAPAMSFSAYYYDPFDYNPFDCGSYGGGYMSPPWTCSPDGSSRHVQRCKDRCDQMINCSLPCASGDSDRCTKCIDNLVSCKQAC